MEPKGTTWRTFSLEELSEATNDFRYDNKLGEGGFGNVYRGLLSDGSQIAVKRLKVLTLKTEMEFAVEVEILGRVKHKNLLSLRGYCAEGQERLIIYDYMPKSSLSAHLHGEYARRSPLDWPKRMNIAIGSAEGLAYLHNHVKPHIIHRDVKSSNILLNSDFQAQVSDFGFARLIPDGATHITTRVKGTLGYLAPEYAMWGKASKSCDLYSFGILLLELVSGKKPIENLASATKCSLANWASSLVRQGRYYELADPKLHGRYNLEELKRVIHGAIACTQIAPEKRPTMDQLINLLKGESKDISMNSKHEENVKLDAIPSKSEQEAHDNSGSNSAGASV